MPRARSLFAYLQAALAPAAALLIAGYFGYHGVVGDTGLLAWGGYRAERAQLEDEAERIARAKAALENRVALLDPERVDPDLADELVRENLGVVRPDEVVVPLTGED